MAKMLTFLNCIVIYVIFILFLISERPLKAAVLDWFWNGNQHDFKNNKERQLSSVNVKFEAENEDEKFLEEALKFTDIMKSSALDVCQHNVVLKIKTSCSSMTEEELAKMSVNLLNCQSSVDGRTLFPCTEDMSLKECTESMDPNMWNAYHMMNNRARAVCLAARRAQFQALSEMTVNKLLTTAQEQITQMEKLQEGQEELEYLTTQTLDTVREGNVNLMMQQEMLQNSQNNIQTSVMKNLRDLSKEKSLIAAGNRELDLIKQKLDETNKELLLQSLERSGHHKQVLNDIENIQKNTDAMLNRIDEITLKLMSHHRLALQRYEEALLNLDKINATVGYLTQLFNATHSELNERIEWIKSFLGESGEELSKVSSTLLHLAYLLMGMLLASFLQLPLVVRAALTLLLPLNLMLVYEQKTDLALDFAQITIILLFITITNILINAIIGYVAPLPAKYYLKNREERNYSNGQPTKPTQSSYRTRAYKYLRQITQRIWELTTSWWTPEGTSDTGGPGVNDSFVSSTGREPEDNHTTASPSYSPYPIKEDQTHHYVSRWLDSSRFHTRANTPVSSASVRSGSPRNMCGAMCRTGRQCRKPRTPGRDYCNIHEAGTSLIG